MSLKESVIERPKTESVIKGPNAEEWRQTGEPGCADCAAAPERTVLMVTGLHCADCAVRLERKIGGLPGVTAASVNFGTSKLIVEGSIPPEEITDAVRNAGYEAQPEVGPSSGVRPESRDPGAGITALVMSDPKALLMAVSGLALGCGIVLSWLKFPPPVFEAFYLASMLTGGYYPTRAAFYALRSGFAFDMNFLMIVAAIGATAIGQWTEGATVIFLFSVGEALESYTMERTRRSIRSLVDLAPKEALVRRNGVEVILPVAEIEIDDIFIVRPGERIAMDGRVIRGSSAVNQAPITGESIPVEKAAGSEVYAGTINEKGSLEVRVTRLVADTTLARIIKLVEEAQAQRAPSQRFVDVFARYYTPSVIALAVGIAAVPPLFGAPFAPWFYRALGLLLVSCPCALVISTPVSIVSAIGNAARHGVLIKGGSPLEQAGALSVVAFDKTGTLTRGTPEVTDVLPLGGQPEDEVLRIASAIEVRSEHPLAEAVIRRAIDRGVPVSEGEGFTSLTGRGARARVEGKTYYIGNPRLFSEDLGLSLDSISARLEPLQAEGKTAMILGSEKELIGIVAVADQVRETSRSAIAGLRRAGVKKVVMLTGDNHSTAEAIARRLGVDEYRAELLPEDKVSAVRNLLARHGKVAMVGDGINDAPALATATVGIAMGGAGTDTALETADIALMADDLSMLPYAMTLSRKALGIIKQNIAFALIVKLAAVLLVFPGWLTLWIAIMADTGASLIVIANGMRLLATRPSR